MKVSVKKTHQMTGKFIDIIDKQPIAEVLASLRMVHSYLVMTNQQGPLIEHFEALSRIFDARPQMTTAAIDPEFTDETPADTEPTTTEH